MKINFCKSLVLIVGISVLAEAAVAATSPDLLKAKQEAEAKG
jgi:hypothetical protein